MDASAPASSGSLLGSLRGLGETVVGTLHDRIELLSLDLREQKIRLVQLALWAGAVIGTGLLALLCASVGIVVFFWERSPAGALGGLALGYTLLCAGLAWALRRALATAPRAFAATLDELSTDRP